MKLLFTTALITLLLSTSTTSSPTNPDTTKDVSVGFKTESMNSGNGAPISDSNAIIHGGAETAKSKSSTEDIVKQGFGNNIDADVYGGASLFNPAIIPRQIFAPFFPCKPGCKDPRRNCRRGC